jgi:membrane-associated phospholipid phosphatase
VADRLELASLWQIRRRTGHPAVVRAARLIGLLGEHAMAWIVLGTLLGLADAERRPMWFSAAAAAVLAHGAGIAIKRVVRRTRPPADQLPPLCRTPSALSFPSAHACSTTAASIMLVPVIGLPAALAIIGAMGFSRLLLGVHYPTDVVAGIGVGAGVAAVVGQFT